MDYKSLYQETKKEYLNVKKGSGNNTIFLVASHSNRMSSMLNPLLEKPLPKLNNGCIVEITNTEIILFNNEKHDDVDSINNTVKDIIKCKQIPENSKESKLLGCKKQQKFPIFNKTFTIPDNKRLILIRHGKGEHNVAKEIGMWNKIKNLKKDPELVEIGKEQAILSNLMLQFYLDNQTFNFVYCASDLLRTQQTISFFMKEEEKDIHIIDCIYETNGSKNDRGLLAFENHSNMTDIDDVVLKKLFSKDEKEKDLENIVKKEYNLIINTKAKDKCKDPLNI